LAKLYIVPTPIGNLKDITLRALECLQQVDFVICEDTRTTGFLLHHYEIKKTLFQFHKHNEHAALHSIIQKIKNAENVALVSDAGTPCISDPGYLLVKSCVENEIEVECLPGATAFVPALVCSGFPSEKFVYMGFLPQKKGRSTAIKNIAIEQKTVVLYESPYRICKLLEEIILHIGDERLVSISREISKKFEETRRGKPSELLEHFTKNEPKGEFVVVINALKS